jgi:glycosyltransferase involved in cell wall biosynthesis
MNRAATTPTLSRDTDRKSDDMTLGAPAAVRVSVVVPTLNEAANLPHVFARLPGGLHEVILVDGHSTDDTIAVARMLRPDIRVVLQDGSGKGDALACGFAAASGDIIVMIDADGSTDPAEMPRFVAALLAGADFAKGSRFMDGAGSADITPLRRVGNTILNTTVNALFGTSYTDLCYGYNAFWSRCLPDMNVTCTGFEVETLINVRIAKAGLDVVEVPSFEAERLHGESKLHVVRDGRRVLMTIARERLRRSGRTPVTVAPTFRTMPIGPTC